MLGWRGSFPGLSSHFVSGCLRLCPFMWDWVLVGVVAFLGFQIVFVSGCLRLSPFVRGSGCWLVR